MDTDSKIEKLILNSSVLEKEMPLLVYLPKNYQKLSSLPVLYFLHGRSGNENIMFEAEINTIADDMITNREIDPMIIVCPMIGNSRGINSSLKCKEEKDIFERLINVGMYEDYLIKEILPLIDNRFKTINNRKGRFIGGASAGGYAALHNALRHQDLFTKVGGHMPALELTLEEEDKPYFKEFENWKRYDPITIARVNPIMSDLDVFLDAGDKDEGGFFEGCSVLHKILVEKCINSQNHIFSGHHNVEYIKSNMSNYLRFYGKSLNQH